MSKTASCAICTNKLNRKYDRQVRIGYLVDVSKEVSKLFTCDEAGNPNPKYAIQVCSQCRYDLLGAIRLWIEGNFVVELDRSGRDRSGETYFDPCPCCRSDIGEGRVLRIAGLQGLDQLHTNLRIEGSTGFLVACRQCRGEFLHDVLTGWVRGGFVRDTRTVQSPLLHDSLHENGTPKRTFIPGANGFAWHLGEAPAGFRIDLFIGELIDLAKLHGQTLAAVFNHLPVVVHPEDEWEYAARRFDETLRTYSGASSQVSPI